MNAAANEKPIARGTTADGKFVSLWADGQITFALGRCIPGVGVAKSEWMREAHIAAGWAVMGEVGAFDAAELSAAIKKVRAVFVRIHEANTVRHYPRPADVRGLMSAACAA